MTQQTMSFQAEVKQLLNLMIHSLYSNKEIFLRELISNASDAADKLRFEAIKNDVLLENNPDLSINISFNNEQRTISIEDNGIGMSKEEIIANLGTIAKSGTRDFVKNLSGDQQKDASLIGQFGVGFYSGFIVADEITVETRRAGCPSSEGVRWQSKGDGEFTVDNIERASRGTTVILHLREGKDEDDFLSAWRLKSIIQKYSDHIAIPIQMLKEEWDEEKKEMVVKEEKETVNQASSLWTRSKNDIDNDQYKNFYQHISHDSTDPLAWTHNRVEGKNEYTQLLYLPAQAPFDLYDRARQHGLKLYVKRVFIMDDAEQLLPTYLRFIRGIVDSSDLPLNVSREILQESRDVKAIREGVTKRVLSMLEDLAEKEPEKYRLFWTQFGQVLKEGIGEDISNKERIAKLLRFASTHNDSDGQNVSLADYVSRMKDGQSKIYYVIADSWLAAKSSPHLEVFNKKGIEVLLLSERVDEWMFSFLNEFDGKPMASVARGDLDLLPDDAEKEKQEKINEEMKLLVEKVKEVLKDKVKDVRITFRLTDSPSCLIADKNEMSGYLQRMLKAAGQQAPNTQPILELNPEHPLVKGLTIESENFDQWCHLFFGQAMLAEGGILEDPASYVKCTNALLTKMVNA